MRWCSTLTLVSALCLGLMGPSPVQAADMDLGYVPSPGPGEKPALLLTPSRTIQTLFVQIEAGGRSYEFDRSNAGGGKQLRFEWPRDTRVTEATAFIRAVYPDGFVDELSVPIQYSYGGSLTVDLSRAEADIKERTLSVSVSAPIERADITAYGAHKAVLDQRTVELAGGPGQVTVPWVGDPEEVVLLEVKVHGANAWAGFTYSPWFLNIPHDDVLFSSNSAAIENTEEWKLEHTLEQLNDVIDKYGAVVPVKLYIAGCTDTVGDSAHNRELSRKRAKAIAGWLRNKGYSHPIFYYGFGEALLAVSTGDGVDNASNRRALYMVGANPPPRSAGIPGVGWHEL